MSTGVKRAMSDSENQRTGAESSTGPAAGERGRRDRDRDRGRHRHRNLPRNLEASINMVELRELIGLITENGLTSFELEREGFRVRIGRGVEPELPLTAMPGGAPVPQLTSAGASTAVGVHGTPAITPSHPGARAEEAASEDQDLHIINSPIVGTFYRASSPTAESFVRIGSNVGPETVVCIIEAMKLMNEIQAETSGEVVKIYVENGQAVEYGQPLFGIKSQ
jgi:acetyl-CoA carboxylase biotin carboxyl carrier protein